MDYSKQLPKEVFNLKTDREKIEVIKAIFVDRKLNTLESCAETLSDIMHIVYNIEKDEKLCNKKSAFF